MTFWQYLNYICAGRRAPSQERFVSPPMAPGQILAATDRRYVVGPNGAWRRLKERMAERPASKSQIRALPKPSRNKYNRLSAAQTATPLHGGDADAHKPGECEPQAETVAAGSIS